MEAIPTHGESMTDFYNAYNVSWLRGEVRSLHMVHN